MSAAIPLDFTPKAVDSFTPKAVDSQTIFDDNPKDAEHTETVKVIDGASQTFFCQVFATKEVRLIQLRHQIRLFGILSAVCLFLLIACWTLRIPYEPAAAMLCCFFGTFMVFVMKVKDAQE